MPTGPQILYDKSFLQAINPDEAFWLGMHFRTNVAPVLIVEVLGDLSKSPPSDRTAEDVVRHLAWKVADLGTQPNTPHIDLTFGELLGYPFSMDGRPIVRGAQRVRGPDGTEGAVIEEPPEMVALNRWRDQDFQAVERDIARHWRGAIERIDLSAAAASMRAGDVFKISDLAAAKALAEKIASPKNGRYQQLRLVLAAYEIPPAARPAVVSRWKRAGGPPLSQFAPYTYYRLVVDLFFNLALAGGLIGTGDAKNKVDIAYLYYLPFCDVFVSGDKLHRRTVPLFLRSDQKFIYGPDLKSDLARLVAYYDALPAAVKEAGAMKYAAHPPVDGDFLVSRLHDEFFPGWRERSAKPVEVTPEENKRIADQAQAMIAAARLGAAGEFTSKVPFDDLDHVTAEFRVRRKVGRWKLF